MFGGVVLLLFLILLGIGVPVAAALGLASVLYLAVDGVNLVIIPHRLIHGALSFQLLAIPLFILAGHLMNIGGITEKIFAFSHSLVGGIRGGLAHVNVVGSMVFAGMTGSALADIAGPGVVEMKAMNDHGYEPEYSAAVVIASATIGPIIPPSIPFIIYGAVAEVSVGRLFLAGIVPGVLMGLAMMILISFQFRRTSMAARVGGVPRRFVRTLFSSLPALLLPVLIVGSLIGGVASPSEVGIIAVVYALILGVLYRSITFRELWAKLLESVESTSVLMLVVSFASVLGWALARDELPVRLAEYALGGDMTPTMFLLTLNAVLLVLGAFMETISIMVILIPVIVPIATKLGVDLVHLGVVVVLNLMIGLLTPPFGMGLLTVSRLANLRVTAVLRPVVPFYVPLIAVLLLITYVPSFVLLVPNLVFGK